jgi:hypothetical protein
MENEQKVIELQRDTVLTGYKLLILHDDETATFCTDCTTTPTYGALSADGPSAPDSPMAA